MQTTYAPAAEEQQCLCVCSERKSHSPYTSEEKCIDRALQTAWEQIREGKIIPAKDVDEYFMSRRWT